MLFRFRKAEIRHPFAAAYGKAVHSRPLLTFGKLTTKFEILSQFRKVEIRHPFAAAYGKAVPSRLSHLLFGKLTTKFEMLCKETKTLQFQSFGGETSGFGRRRDTGV